MVTGLRNAGVKSSGRAGYQADTHRLAQLLDAGFRSYSLSL
jgi:hypothetical protein